ncbi:MAG: hypothetical protein A3J06_02500 [Candidatus Moranbacteria bacterium RIFCSPLOWO2_02_FULL_48_19]|nr:MAG: hypothetical protein A3J06_02500 [Candidatus Moranbacteria bacterium RIFCSPLOWO2_02_FULL_48_19]OGI30195.1 MAG: hypothetical protein A3G09_03180 [Candidatus Moranbacteria bacterium RIFCSPLOWO2_12_FULL_48_12]
MENTKLGKQLVLDELFDLTLYRELRKTAGGETAVLLDELIPIEERHFRFWQDFFKVAGAELGKARRFKLSMVVLFCRVFRGAGVSLILEAIEINGVKKYLRVWEMYKDEPLGKAVREILDDELRHEDAIVSDKIKRQVHPERIRDVFLGLNDGLVEILGTLSGFFAAFHSVSAVLGAVSTVAIAGAFSMAAGAFVAISSEREVEATEKGKKKFMSGETDETKTSHPLASALVVGISYLFGAAIPILPVFFGAENIWLSLLVSGAVIIGVSYLLAFLSGMEVKRRIAMNLVIIGLAVAVTWLIGILARDYFGINV